MNVRPAVTMYVFAAYLAGLGAVLLIVPNVLLSIFGIPETTEVWIRVVGMLVLILALYYFQMARDNNRVFFQTSVYGRASVIVFFTVFVALGYAKPALILFGGIDLLGAIWTWFTLRSTSK